LPDGDRRGVSSAGAGQPAPARLNVICHKDRTGVVQLHEVRIPFHVMRETMKRATIVEGAILLVISLTGIIQGLQLNAIKDPQRLALLMGPGTYILVLSSILLITAVAHVLLDYRKGAAASAKTSEVHASKKLILMIVVFALYAFLIDIFGYIIPTILFFLLEFRLAGVTSWKVNTILTAGLVVSFYFIFIKYCEMIFPYGIF
jgi:hypothetical protein